MTRPAHTSPIIFSTPMIRALLDGRKTQTRRLITSQWANVKRRHEAADRCLLWVRENIVLRDTEREGRTFKQPRYAADDSVVMEGSHSASNHYFLPRLSVPSIHMPRWASRLTLELYDVRFQRLQDISEIDAMAEVDPKQGLIASENTHSDWYRSLWESLQGPGSWDANPEVVAFSFRVHRQNVDAVIGEAPCGS